MAYLRTFNIIISYKTLELDLKQIKEELGFDLDYKEMWATNLKMKAYLKLLPSTLMLKIIKLTLKTNSIKL